MTTSKQMEGDLKKKIKKNGRRPKKKEKKKKKDNPPKKRPKQKWKTNQSTKINLIGCDTIENSPSFDSYHFYFNLSNYMVASLSQKSFTF